MVDIQIVMAGATAVILFVFGLENFSKEIEKISGEKFRRFLTKATKMPLAGVGLGASITAIVQSSSATSVIAIGLVNAGVLSFKNSVGIIFGSNIGTTITAQLVAFKLTAFAPVFIIVGFLLSFIHSKYSIFAKTIFYFGFVFFSLNLISSSLSPLQQDARLIGFLTQDQNPFLAILFGCLFTAVVQSSSVTTGLAVIFTQQGLMSLENAVPIIMGANIGTTATAALAMVNMDMAAKKTALSHFLFNFGGVVLFTPIFLLFGHQVGILAADPAVALANFHLIFNVSTSVVFLLLLNPFVRMVDRFLGEGKMDFERIVLPVFDETSGFTEVQDDFVKNERNLLLFLQENYNLVTLSIETNYKKISENCEKRLDYIDFLRSETLSYFSRIVTSISDEEESKTLLKEINRYDYLFQIHDSIKDLFHTKKTMEEHYIELNSDLLMFIRDISNRSMSLFSSVHDSLDKKTAKYSRVKKDAHDLQTVLDEVNKGLLALIANPERRDAGALTHLVTYSQRLKDKLVNFSITKSNPLKKGFTSRDQDITKEPVQIKKTIPPKADEVS
jgi:phosphate:Na+ symporter